MKKSLPLFIAGFLACFSLPVVAAESASSSEKKKAEIEVPLKTTGQWQSQELGRFPASEANQAVVADAAHLYVIGNTTIGKYRKDSHEKVAAWKQPKGGPLIHMNAGIMHKGQLWCAHSNFPHLPMTSSIEIFDPEILEHRRSISLGIAPGSLTWIVRHDNRWYACFAHYAKDSAKTGRGPESTELVSYDDEWRRMQGWVFPAPLVQIFGSSSCSGGSMDKEGTLFITGHDEKQLFVLKFPQAGSVLEWVDSIPIAAEGQAFSWDPNDATLFYGIIKHSREVVIQRITKSAK